MIVVDASVLVDFLLGYRAAVETVAERVRHAPHEPLCAPDLVYPETLNALRRYVARGLIDDGRASEAAFDLACTRLSTYPHAPLLNGAWAHRHNLSAYDASYLALAEAVDRSVLMTADRALAEVSTRSLGPQRVCLVT